MKRTPRHLLMFVLVMVAFVVSASAQGSLEQQGGRSPNSPTIKAEPSEIPSAGLRTPNPREVLRVSVSAEAWTGTYVTYRSGDNFVVVVPQARTSAIRWELSGWGLSGVQSEQRGDDAVLLFRVQSQIPPSVQQQLNRLDLIFTLPAAQSAIGNSEPQTIDSIRIIEPSANNISRGIVTSDPVPRAEPLILAQPANALNRVSPQGIGATLTELLKKNTTADALNLDLSVPESPAFTVLGLNPQTVARPATPQQFATSLLNGLDSNGNLQNGLAIDTAPYMLFNGPNVTIRDYMDQYLTRLLSRTQFSLAAVKGASKDDLSSRLSLGLNLSLWDRGDPRIYRPGEEGDVLDCFVRNLDSTIPIPPDIDPDDPEAVQRFVAPELARLKPLADKCRAEGRKARWNRSAWTIAYAPSWISTTGNSSDFKWNGGAFWTSAAYGFEEVPSLKKIAQLIFHARHRTRERVSDPNNAGKFLTQNATFVGARFRAGSPKFAFNLEDGFLRTRTVGSKTGTSNRFSVGAELSLTDNLYFVISTGGSSGRTDGKSTGFVMSSFKYGFNKKPQLNPQPQ